MKPTKDAQKKPIARIRLQLLANRAAPSPLLGQSLGQYGINIMEFCKAFNNHTKNIKPEANILIPTYIEIYNHNLFDISVKTPTTSYLLRAAQKRVAIEARSARGAETHSKCLQKKPTPQAAAAAPQGALDKMQPQALSTKCEKNAASQFEANRPLWGGVPS